MWRSNELLVKDRRKTVRYSATGIVHIQGLIGGPVKDCRLTDISDGGVRLYAEGLTISDEFTLWLSANSAERRKCRVVWRLGHEIGAAFTDQPQDDFGRQTALVHFGNRR
jgi:hypothetical protein